MTTASGIPPQIKNFFNLSTNGLKKISGMGSSLSILSMYANSFGSSADKNSEKLMGFTCKKSTFPTGNEFPFDMATPNNDPALVTAYSGAFS
ncbi:hypothetical protein D3C85_1665820 [compost metagenome]